ncbi:nucleoside 2-deoxyribosyltransferase [Patescibacteria group bacterium]|nr:nucleoside 2-deoxyribosyltransferase [Patescibacteria group bacterium]MBU1472696.1 nucleoside 2-deoxyribosyltransferase [Patescibacteria group bacterium]MBU2459963.1 nucleoside 2-deoxyribosyltransferase [Patescibacteria group bacterium]MBU2544379.1 nucleoside 2-deoxyribosyltransferase [Patescibacteria group bacterium]
MKVYFTASIVGKKYYLSQYLNIVEVFKSRKHSIIADHILQATEEQINLGTKKERLDFHKKLEGWINSCDCMVVEASFPSISVGYEISMALHRGKPVLILYSTGDPPSLFAFHEDEQLITQRYTMDSLREIIDDFINFVKGAHDSRFTFYITSRISAYLDRVSMKKKIPKSVYLRTLIEKDMDK